VAVGFHAGKCVVGKRCSSRDDVEEGLQDGV
jgi:hypothetical protein